MFGNHCIKTCSQTQETIALSSGESEFYAIVKAATMGLGMNGLMEDLGVEVEVQVNTDSSAAKSMKCKERCWASTTHRSARVVGTRSCGERRAQDREGEG